MLAEMYGESGSFGNDLVRAIGGGWATLSGRLELVYRRGAEDAENDLRELNEVSGAIVDAAIRVHSVLGPGLLESAYANCLAYELRERGLTVRTQVPLPVVYKTIRLPVGYRIDLVVEEAVIVEIKTVESILPIHQAQLLTYLRLSHRRLGLLLNFHVPFMRDGIKRLVNTF